MSGTPGPWRVFGYEVVDAKNQRVASTATPSRPHPEERANASLIAAAPELLNEARRLWDRYEPAAINLGKYDTDMEDLGVAIAKAEGSNQ